MNDIIAIRDIISNGMKLNAHATSANGVHIVLPNDYEVSIQWGYGTYSDNHDLWEQVTSREEFNAPLNSQTAEVAVIHPNGQLIETPFGVGDTVIGWCTPEKVMQIINWAMTLNGLEKGDNDGKS